MSPSWFSRVVPSCAGQLLAPHGFVHRVAAKSSADDDWDDEDLDPESGEPWDSDVLDDDEPQPEPGDFWPEFDDD